MISNLLNRCCYKCDQPDIQIETNTFTTTLGDEYTDQKIKCSHCKVCKRFIEEDEVRGGE